MCVCGGGGGGGSGEGRVLSAATRPSPIKAMFGQDELEVRGEGCVCGGGGGCGGGSG